jgi:hypothetical protein
VERSVSSIAMVFVDMCLLSDAVRGVVSEGVNRRSDMLTRTV